MPIALTTLTESQPTVPVQVPQAEEDWSFAHLKRVETLWGPHGYHRYPAKFIPQVVRRVIECYSIPGSLVGDPFLGSATTGIEALRSGRRFWGADINPVALLISQAKCTPIDPQTLWTTWVQLDQQLAALPCLGPRTLTEEEKAAIIVTDIARADSQQRFAYWFPTPYATILEQILQRVTALPDEPIRTFFLCAFSNILRGCSIWLSGSTKPQKDLQKTLSDPVGAFRRQVREMIRRNTVYWDDLRQSHLNPATITNQCAIVLGDARHLPLGDGELDLIVTSPPYATCYQYIELHQLTQLWFEKYHLLPSNDLQHACIGGKVVSLRHQSHDSATLLTESGVADTALAALEKVSVGAVASAVAREVRALRYYFQDMHAVLKEFARVVAPGKYLVIIIGDSCKRGIPIPTSNALCEMAVASGFELEQKIVRKVPVRVLVSTRDKSTGRFSSTAQNHTQVYPEEDILILKRRGKTDCRRGGTHE